jgi:capsular polysaccharide biosynthesis protein
MTLMATTDRAQAGSRGSPARRIRPATRAAILIALALLGGVIGWAVGSQSVSYVSKASMVVNPLPGNPLFEESVSDLETLQTEAQRTRSDAVLSAVVEELDGDISQIVLQRRVSVTVAPGSEILEVSYRGASAAASATIAEALAEATLRDRKQRASDLLSVQTDELTGAASTTKRALSAASSQADEQRLARRLVWLKSQIRDLKAKPLDPGSVIGVSTAQISSKSMKAIGGATGALLGAMFGLWLLFWVNRRLLGGPS